MPNARTKRAEPETIPVAHANPYFCPHCEATWQGRKTIHLEAGKPLRCPRCSRRLPGASPDVCCCTDCTARRERA